MKMSKKDFVIIDNLLVEKLKKLRLYELDLKISEPYMSSYDFLEKDRLVKVQIDNYTKVRNKILKLMEV